jgi:hypothetical protein
MGDPQSVDEIVRESKLQLDARQRSMGNATDALQHIKDATEHLRKAGKSAEGVNGMKPLDISIELDTCYEAMVGASAKLFHAAMGWDGYEKHAHERAAET